MDCECGCGCPQGNTLGRPRSFPICDTNCEGCSCEHEDDE